jgi:hypothetical protein
MSASDLRWTYAHLSTLDYDDEEKPRSTPIAVIPPAVPMW